MQRCISELSSQVIPPVAHYIIPLWLTNIKTRTQLFSIVCKRWGRANQSSFYLYFLLLKLEVSSPCNPFYLKFVSRGTCRHKYYPLFLKIISILMTLSLTYVHISLFNRFLCLNYQRLIKTVSRKFLNDLCIILWKL